MSPFFTIKFDLLNLLFDRWLKIALSVISFFGLLVFFKIPLMVYQWTIERTNQFFVEFFGTNGNLKTVDAFYHTLGKSLLVLGISAIFWLWLWHWLLDRAQGIKVQERIPPTLQYFKVDWIVIILITTIAFVLRIVPITQSLWADEISVYMNFIKPGFLSNIFPSQATGSHPFMQMVVFFFTKIFGVSEFSLRFPILFLSVISTPLVFYVASKIFHSKVAGYFAAVILCFHTYHIYYSFQMRGYNFVVFFGILSAYYLCQIFEKPSRKVAILLALVNALAMFSHLYSIFLIISEHIVIVLLAFCSGIGLKKIKISNLHSTLKEYLFSFVITIVATGIVYSTQMLNIIKLTFNPDSKPIPILSHVKDVFETIHWVGFYSHQSVLPKLFMFVMSALGLWLLSKSYKGLILLLVSFFTFLLIFLLPSQTGFFPRYLTPILPFLVLIFSGILFSFWTDFGKRGKVFSFVLLFLFLILSTVGFQKTYQPIQNYRGALVFSNSLEKNQLPIFSYSLGKELYQYYDKNIVPVENSEHLLSLINNYGEIFLINSYYEGYTSEKVLDDFVSKKCEKLRVFEGEFPVIVRKCIDI